MARVHQRFRTLSYVLESLPVVMHYAVNMNRTRYDTYALEPRNADTECDYYNSFYHTTAS